MNRFIRTVIVVLMTTCGRPYPTRVPCRFKGKVGQIVSTSCGRSTRSVW